MILNKGRLILLTALMAGSIAASAAACEPVFFGGPSNECAKITVGGAGADAVLVIPLNEAGHGGAAGEALSADSVRVSVTVDPVRLNTQALGRLIVLPIEAQAGTALIGATAELTRVKASVLRTTFSRAIPVTLGSLYRDLDRGVAWGADLVGIRVPIRLDDEGKLVVLPGLELGVRHYQAPLDATALHASFLMDGRVARRLFDEFMSVGAMGRLRYDFDAAGAGGLEEEGMLYLSLLLDADHKLHARVYAGVDHRSSREQFGLPTLSAFGGLGLYGEFGSR